ncbi:hypothetical protein V5799_029437 [Amblyomma americanum]|uniref:Uncharacterized protein n=1 Tax=Amblyomma americanum TaxID=6943 RepID=A0AAQ4ER68_AMBAM
MMTTGCLTKQLKNCTPSVLRRHSRATIAQHPVYESKSGCFQYSRFKAHHSTKEFLKLIVFTNTTAAVAIDLSIPLYAGGSGLDSDFRRIPTVGKIVTSLPSVEQARLLYEQAVVFYSTTSVSVSSAAAFKPYKMQPTALPLKFCVSIVLGFISQCIRSQILDDFEEYDYPDFNYSSLDLFTPRTRTASEELEDLPSGALLGCLVNGPTSPGSASSSGGPDQWGT